MRSSGRSFDVLLEALEVKMVRVKLKIEMHHKTLSQVSCNMVISSDRC